jgi:hypothetical protein
MNLLDAPLQDVARSSVAMPECFVATVSAANDGAYTLVGELGVFNALRAPSCVVVPEVGDLVGCWRYGTSATPCRIVCVLDRDASAITRLDMGQRLALSCETADLRVGLCTLIAQRVESVATSLCTTVREWLITGSRWSSVFHTEVHQAHWHQRQVDGMDRLDAQVIDHKASDGKHHVDHR